MITVEKNVFFLFPQQPFHGNHAAYQSRLSLDKMDSDRQRDKVCGRIMVTKVYLLDYH